VAPLRGSPHGRPSRRMHRLPDHGDVPRGEGGSGRRAPAPPPPSEPLPPFCPRLLQDRACYSKAIRPRHGAREKGRWRGRASGWRRAAGRAGGGVPRAVQGPEGQRTRRARGPPSRPRRLPAAGRPPRGQSGADARPPLQPRPPGARPAPYTSARATVRNGGWGGGGAGDAHGLVEPAGFGRLGAWVGVAPPPASSRASASVGCRAGKTVRPVPLNKGGAAASRGCRSAA
jgi:hypothetical protein